MQKLKRLGSRRATSKALDGAQDPLDAEAAVVLGLPTWEAPTTAVARHGRSLLSCLPFRPRPPPAQLPQQEASGSKHQWLWGTEKTRPEGPAPAHNIPRRPCACQTAASATQPRLPTAFTHQPFAPGSLGARPLRFYSRRCAAPLPQTCRASCLWGWTAAARPPPSLACCRKHAASP
jgi:hypothetical protein